METNRDRREQERAITRRRTILDATIGLLLHLGASHVTHRNVAEAAGVPLGAIRYYYGTRAQLLLSVFDEMEGRRTQAALDAIGSAERGPMSSIAADEVAALLLRCCYGEDLGDQTIRGTLRWFVDAGGESSELARRLASVRPTVEDQVRQVLVACGYPALLPSLVVAVTDGAIAAGVTEARSHLASIVREHLLALLELCAAKQH